MRIKLTVEYDGTDFSGWQTQTNGRTVQQELETAINALTGENVSVTGSGRTDAGVHAEGQVAHFDTEANVPPEKFAAALNGLLPQDVKVIKSEEAPEGFHARYSAKRKTYEYRFYISPVARPLKERYACRLDAADADKMRETAELFIGTHDFKAFRKTGSGAKTTVRTVYAAKVKKRGDEVIFTVCGNGFLYGQVRLMAGALTAVSDGKIEMEDVKTLLLGEAARPAAVKTLPAKGLTLKKAEYPAKRS